MPAIDEIVRVNQTTFAWGSSRFLIDGVPYEGILSIDYEEKLEIKEVHAARRDGRPVAYAGNGKYSVPNFKMRMLKDTFAVFQAQLAAGGLIRPGLGSYGDALWAFSAQCVEPIVGSTTISMVAAPCKVMGKRETREEGIEELVTEIDIKALNVIENGIPLWSLARSIGA